jgi:hypothetical protein
MAGKSKHIFSLADGFRFMFSMMALAILFPASSVLHTSWRNQPFKIHPSIEAVLISFSVKNTLTALCGIRGKNYSKKNKKLTIA